MRVIAGELGGRRLVAPRGDGTRPTTDRVREALFSILGARVSGAVVLDLYAGTGALGIEALSRGAARAVFVESARPAQKALEKNLRDLDLAPRSRVVAAAVRASRAAIVEGGPYDLVFADPPYEDAPDALAFLAELWTARPEVGSPEATLVLEHASKVQLEGPPWSRDATRRYGDSALSFYSSS